MRMVLLLTRVPNGLAQEEIVVPQVMQPLVEQLDIFCKEQKEEEITMTTVVLM
jgi:hypothetical protein